MRCQFIHLSSEENMDAISDFSVHPIKESNYVRPYSVSFVQNGQEKKWDLIKKHDSVAVLIHNITRDVFVFVKQFRAAIYMDKAHKLGLADHTGGTVDAAKLPGSEGITHELCAGIVDKKCSLVEIAKDEVLEECGYEVPVENIHKISTMRDGVGLSGHQHTLFYGQVTDSMKVGPGGGVPESGELIEVIEVPVKDSLDFVMNDKMDRPTGMVAALLWFHTPAVKKTFTV